MHARLPIFLVLAVVSVLAAVGDYFSKRWADGTAGGHSVTVALVCYCMCTCLWFPVIRYGKDLSRITSMWVIVTMLSGVLMGTLFFNERLTTVNIVGIVFGLLGIICISI